MAGALVATGQERRFKPLAESEMSEAQRKVYGEIAA